MSTPSQTGAARGLRPDIEGMRALAVGAVLVFHAGLPWFKGGFVGVDAFFVLSGYLITGLLSREVARTGRVRIGAFWARRIRRLLPASATVLAFSAIVTWVYLPITQRQAFGGDIVSAALYVVNWRLADRSVDYLAQDVGSSPVQHYWSLSVEEQFYLLWPILMLVIGVAFAKRWRPGAFAVLGAITAISFAYSVAQSQSSPATAFFVSTTRVWELGVGALLALSAHRVAKLPTAVRASAGWLGLAAFAYAVVAFDGTTTWPGIPALVPTVGAALMIASGITLTAGSPQRLLSLAPLVWIGGLSYSLYLWHWPMLIAAQAKYPHLRLRWTVLLMALSIVPAWLCHTYIENPIRFGTPFRATPRALGLGLALTTVGVVLGFGLNATLGDTVQEADKADSPGAAALLDASNASVTWSDIKSVDTLRPLPTQAKSDRPTTYDDGSGCQVPGGDPKPKVCVHGDRTADKTLLIIGDSKIAQWETVLSAMGSSEGWRVVTITKNYCPFTDASITSHNRVDVACREWGKAAMTEILKLKPDVVLTSQRASTALPEGKTDGHDRTREAMGDGLRSYWSQIEGAGIPLVVLLDNPSPTTAPVYECVAQHPKNLTVCAFDTAKGIAGSAAGAQRAAVAGVPGVKVIDMTDTICPDDGRCPAVIGNVLVYRQGSHLTRSYIDSMRPQLARQLARATEGEFGRD